MNKAVSKVLNRVLGDFIENLNPDQLNLSIFSGTVSLENLRVKSEALDKLGLPFKLGSGFVGTIKVEIPWTSLSSSPLKITVEDVIVLLLPHPKKDWDENEQRLINQKARRSAIDSFETMNSEDVSVESSPGMIEKLITKIVDNIQINLKNVYVRVEDSESFSQEFALGLKIGGISCHTCDANWNPTFMESSSESFKLIKLTNFAVYSDFGKGYPLVATEYVAGMESRQSFEELAKHDFAEQIAHKYLISPISFRTEIIMNKNIKDVSKPQFAISASSEEIKAGIIVKQMTHFIKLAEYISQFFQFREGVANSETYKDMDQADMIRYRTSYTNWKSFSSDNNRNSKKFAEENLLELHEMEENFALTDILKQRESAINDLGVKRQAEEKRKEIEVIKESYKPSKGSSIKGWFGYGKSEEQQDKEKTEMEAKLLIAQQELEEILGGSFNQARSEIMELVSGVETIDMTNLPELYDRITFKLEIKRQSFHLGSVKSLLSCLDIFNTELNLAIKPSGMIVDANIKSIEIIDGKSEKLLESGFLDLKYSNVGQTSVDLNSGDFNFNVRIDSLLEIVSSFKSELVGGIDKDFYQNKANETVNYYVDLGKKYVDETIVNTKAKQIMKLNINLSAPKIRIPLDLVEMANGFIILDFGRLHLFNGEVTESNSLYECYSFELTNFKLAACEHDILSPVSFNFKFMNILQPNVNDATPVLLDSFLNKVKFSLRDDLFLTVQKFQTLLMSKLESLNPQIPDEGNLAEIKKIPDFAASGNSGQPRNVSKTEITAEKLDVVPISKTSSMKTRFQIKEIGFSLFIKRAEVISFTLSELKNEVEVYNDGSVNIDLSLKRIDLLDKREGVHFKAIFSNPLITAEDGSDYFSQKENHQNLMSDHDLINNIYQIRAGLYMDSKRGVSQASILIDGIRIILVHSFVTELLEFSKGLVPSHPQKLNQTVQLAQPTENLQNIIATNNIEASLSLSSFELWLPLSEKSDSKIASIKVSPILHFNSLKTIEGGEHSFIDDELTLEIRHFTVLLGKCVDNKIEVSSFQLMDFIQPCRIIVNYESRKESREDITTTEIGVNLESIGIAVGFRDIYLFKEIAANWSKVSGSQSKTMTDHKSQEVVESKDIFKIVVVCDSLQLTLIHDSGRKSYELINASFSNFGANIQLTPDLDVTFSTIFLINYYNLNVASWEPLIEDWIMNIYVKRIQNSYKIDFDSDQDLNINLTYEMMKTIGTLLYIIAQTETEEESVIESQETHELKETVHKDITYKVVNLIGKPAYVRIDKEAIENKDTLVDDENFAFYSQKSLNKIYSKKGTSKNIRAPAKLIVKIGNEVCKPFNLEDSKTKARKIGNEIIIIEVECRDNERILKLQTNKIIMNNTDIDLVIRSQEGQIILPALTSIPLPAK